MVKAAVCVGIIHILRIQTNYMEGSGSYMRMELYAYLSPTQTAPI